MNTTRTRLESMASIASTCRSGCKLFGYPRPKKSNEIENKTPYKSEFESQILKHTTHTHRKVFKLMKNNDSNILKIKIKKVLISCEEKWTKKL